MVGILGATTHAFLLPPPAPEASTGLATRSSHTPCHRIPALAAAAAPDGKGGGGWDDEDEDVRFSMVSSKHIDTGFLKVVCCHGVW